VDEFYDFVADLIVQIILNMTDEQYEAMIRRPEEKSGQQDFKGGKSDEISPQN
jgi:hypothetical protein